jgi:hypothetical protein
MPPYVYPAAVQSAEHESGAMLLYAPAKNPKVREAASIQQPAYARPFVDVALGAAEDDIAVLDRESEAELDGVEDALALLDGALVGAGVIVGEPPAEDQIERRQLPPHFTAVSPAQAMLQSESGDFVPIESELPQ